MYIPVQDSSKLYSFTYNAEKSVSLWTSSGRKKVLVTILKTHTHTHTYTHTHTHTHMHARAHILYRHQLLIIVMLQLTVEDHIKAVEAFRPDVVQCLCDTIPASSGDVSVKRVRKSVDRTLKFLDETLLAAEKSKV